MKIHCEKLAAKPINEYAYLIIIKKKLLKLDR